MSSVTPSVPGSLRSQIVLAAKQAGQAAAGVPYLYTGKSTAGFDCSGFVAYVYEQVLPDYVYMDTEAILNDGRFTEVAVAAPGDLILFPKGKNPYEVQKGNDREFPNHVGIVLDASTWIGSQSSTGVAEVKFTNPWWSARTKVFLRYTAIPPA